MNPINKEDNWRFEENPACLFADISFGIVSPNLDPDFVTEALGLKPTTSNRLGDTFKSRAGRIATHHAGRWRVESSRLIQSTSVVKNALALLDYLEPQKNRIQQFAKTSGHRIVIRFKWEATDNSYGGFSLDSEIMGRLAALCTDIHFYFIGARKKASKGQEAELADEK